MRVVIRHQNGRRAAGLLLALSKSRIRVAVTGRADIQEWSIADGFWRDERGQPIEVEAIVADDLDSPGVYREVFAPAAVMGAAGG